MVKCSDTKPVFCQHSPYETPVSREAEHRVSKTVVLIQSHILLRARGERLSAALAAAAHSIWREKRAAAKS